MSSIYNPKDYWEERLKKRFNLRGVGNIGFTERYNVWLYRRKRHCIENCFRTIPLRGKTILDVGCGTGFFVDWYRKAGASVTGIDITDTSIERLKKQYDCEFHLQDITDENYQPIGSFDIVNMWDVIYHVVSPEKFAQAFYNISRSIKSGGLLLFTDWFGLDVDSRIADHVQARCLKTYEQALPKNGFELIKTYPLYYRLNQTNFGRLDNYLGWLYFALDNRNKDIKKDNISLSVWRYSAR